MRLQPSLLILSLAPLAIAVAIPKATVVLFFAVALAAIPWRRIREIRLWDGLPSLAWMALPALGAISALWALDAGNALSVSGKLALFALAMVLMGRAIPPDSIPRAQLARINVACLVVGIVIVLGRTGLWMIEIERIGLPKNSAVLLVLMTFPAIAAMAALGWARWKMAVLVALVALACYVSRSSSAMVGLAAGLMVLAVAFRYPAMARKAIPFVLAALPVAALALPFLADAQWVAERVPYFPTAFYHRLVIWDFVAENVLTQPLFGWGMDAARSLGGGRTFDHVFQVPWYIKPYVVRAELLPLHPHNAWLQVWLELGAVGAVLVSWLLWRVARSAAAHPDSTLLALLVAIVTVASFAYGTWQSWWVAAVLLCWHATRVQGLTAKGA